MAGRGFILSKISPVILGRDGAATIYAFHNSVTLIHS